MSEAVLQTIIICSTVLASVLLVVGLGAYGIYKTDGSVSVEGEKGGAVRTGRCAE